MGRTNHWHIIHTRGGGPLAASSQLTVVFTARYIRTPKVWASLPRTNWSSPKRSKVTRGLQHRIRCMMPVWRSGPTPSWATKGHPSPLDAAPHHLPPCGTQSHKEKVLDRYSVTLQGHLAQAWAWVAFGGTKATT